MISLVSVLSLPDEIPSLLEMLLQYGHTHEARQLHTLFNGLVESTRSSIYKIWPDKTTPTHNQVHVRTGLVCNFPILSSISPP